jgi:hypothetical protein
MGVTRDNINISPEGAKLAVNYQFKAAQGIVIVEEVDFEEVLYIINVESNTTIYNVADPFLTGKILDNQVEVDFDTTAMADGDKLLIVYASKDKNGEEDTLVQILTAINTTNKLLKKILK